MSYLQARRQVETASTQSRGPSDLLPTFSGKQWWNVDYVFNETLSSIVILGSPTRSGQRHVVIPLATETKLTIRFLRKLLSEGAAALDAYYTSKVSRIFA